MNNKIRILWADDEIDLLKSQIYFLEDKGYAVEEVTNGTDAVEKCAEGNIDVVFLDENMPGLSGLETLSRIKEQHPELPIVMITKSEEENLMEEAIGQQITDYLIKPVKPHQILLTLKKIIDNTRLVQEKTTSAYQQDFQNIFMAFQDDLDHQEWADVYKKLIFWELSLERSKTSDMKEVLTMQKQEANREFCKFVMRNYVDWVNGEGNAPVMSHTLMEKKVWPNLSNDRPTIFLVIDNLRYDQWKVMQPMVNEMFKLREESIMYSILPTATQYSRNAMFAGMMPLEIEQQFPKLWKNDEDKGGKNLFEEDLLREQIARQRLDIKSSYKKVASSEDGEALVDSIHNALNYDFSVIVYNFVDMLSHARTEMEVLRELARDEAAYRSITYSWFEHSPLLKALKRIADKPFNLMIGTDHGTMRVNTPSKVVGDRNTTTNLRYKTGKNLNYEPKEVFEVKDPHKALLPRQHVSSRYIFAPEDKYFVYPNNYNYFVNYYKDTFQHGGISLEEVVVPFALYTNA
jgi:DNA-binding response OmpR family regulator